MKSKFGLLSAIFMTLALTSCGSVDTAKAVHILESQGLSEINLTGYSFIFSGCSKGDNFNSGFDAKDLHGNKVTGVVCGGWVKGYTVRYF